MTLLDLYNIKEQREAEKKLRLEKGLQMREVFLEKQMNWKAFREAEQKRRDDKAKREELNRYSEIVAESRARKEYNELMFQQTHTVRSHTGAALIIQKAYRGLRLRRQLAEKVNWRAVEQRRRREERAARAIQRTWREYQQYKLYQRVNYKKVRTSPVITLKTGRTLTKVASYQKGISITGLSSVRLYGMVHNCMQTLANYIPSYSREAYTIQHCCMQHYIVYMCRLICVRLWLL